MPRPAQIDAPFGELCRRGVHFIRQACFGKNEIQPYQQDAVLGKVVRMLGTFGGELGQDPFNFQFFFRRQLPQLVVCLHRRHRLNKQRHAGR